MKRQHFVSEHVVKRPHRNRDWSDEDEKHDRFKRSKIMKSSYAEDGIIWNKDSYDGIGSGRRYYKSRNEIDKRSEAGYSSSDSGGQVEQEYKDLCVSYIPSRILDSDLEDGLLMEFEKYGRVSVKIMNSGVDRLAYLRFAHQESARRAYRSIEEHPLLLDNRKVDVVPCYKKNFEPELLQNVSALEIPHFSRSGSVMGERRYREKSNDSTLDDRSSMTTRVLFVGNLPKDVEKHDLERIFGKYGTIEDIDIKIRLKSKMLKIFAFIKFSSVHSAVKAKENLHNSYIKGRICKIGYGQLDADVIRENRVNKPHTEASESKSMTKWKSLSVKHIPHHLSTSELIVILKKKFKRFGPMDIDINRINDNRTADIHFQYHKDAKSALEANHNLFLDNKPVKIVPLLKSDGISLEHERYPERERQSHDYHQNLETKSKYFSDVHSEKHTASDTPTNLLFVGKLDSNVRRYDLMNVFSKFGNIDDIDYKTSKNGKGYAFVTFQSVSSAERAYKEISRKKTGKDVWKLGYSKGSQTEKAKTENILKRSHRHPEFENEMKIVGLQISQIPISISDHELKNILQATYKQINKRMKVVVKIKKNHKIAYVYFSHPSYAVEALAADIPLKIMKATVSVSPLTKRSVTDEDEVSSTDDTTLEPELDEKATRTLFLGNLPSDVSEKEIRQQFETFGPIEFVTIKRLQGNKAYGFVKYINMDFAYKAKVAMNGKIFKDCKLRIGYGKSVVTSCLWVGGLGSWVNIETIRKEFRRFGDIRRIVWPAGTDFAYVQYESNSAAQAACLKFHGWPMGGLDKRLRVDFVSVNQILNALEDGRKTSVKNNDLVMDGEDSLESDSSESDHETSLEQEPSLNTSRVSDDPLNVSFDSSNSPNPETSNKLLSCFHPKFSDHESSEEGSVWMQPQKPLMLKGSHFSDADEKLERTVFIHSKEKDNDYDFDRDHQPRHKTSGLPDLTSEGIDESLNREIKHYRIESCLPKRSSNLFKEELKNVTEKSMISAEEPRFRRDDCNQYKCIPVIDEYNKKDKYQRKSKVSNLLMDFNQQEVSEKAYQLSPDRREADEEFYHRSSRQREHFHDVKQYLSESRDKKVYPVNTSVAVDYNKLMQFRRDEQITKNRNEHEEIISRSTTSFEFTKLFNNSGSLTPAVGVSSLSSVMHHSVNSETPVSYDDFHVKQKPPNSLWDPGSHQSFDNMLQQTASCSSFTAVGNTIQNIFGTGNNTLNIPGSLHREHTSTQKQPMITPSTLPFTYVDPYSMNYQHRDQSDLRRTGAYPSHIQR